MLHPPRRFDYASLAGLHCGGPARGPVVPAFPEVVSTADHRGKGLGLVACKAARRVRFRVLSDPRRGCGG